MGGVYLQIRGREVYNGCARRVDRKEPNVPRTVLKTAEDRRGIRIFHRDQFNPDAPCKGPSDVHRHAPQFAGLRVLDGPMWSDNADSNLEFTGPNDVRDP